MTTPKALEIKLEVALKACISLRKSPLSIASERHPSAPPKSPSILLLRVHRIGHRYTQTIKASGNSRLFEREEWEAQFGGAQPDLRR
jgi:hypothetical protein